MTRSKFALPLPRYVRRKLLKGSGQWAYFFDPPTWARKGGCKIEACALGTDYAEAVQRAETVLLPLLDSWRTGGKSDAVPDKVRSGTLDWLLNSFQATRQFRELDERVQKLHRSGFKLVSNFALKDGRLLGEIALSAITPGVADKVFDALLTVKETIKNADGSETTIERSRRTTINHAMKSVRRAWNVMGRMEEKNVPARNPFSRMGLKDTSKITPTATFEELMQFVDTCDRCGRTSIGTGAMISFEWLQRVEHVFTAFEVAHYRPKDRPHMVRVVHPKTAEEAWIPLFDAGGKPLYPELMERLDRIKASRIAGPMLVRDWVDKKSGTPIPWVTQKGDISYLHHEAARLFAESGLRTELTMTSFRHGGFTEGADSDLTDAELRAIGRHKNSKTLPRYAKRTVKQVEKAQQKRRASRTNGDDLSE